MKLPHQTKNFSHGLDVFRGIAAVLMVINHAGYRLLSASDISFSVSGFAVFLGSLAPALFFFATGFGMALANQARDHPPPVAPALWKGLLLVWADQLLWWGRGVPMGLDFFSFIAIATVIVTLMLRFKKPVLLSFAIICVLVCVRYLLGPQLNKALLPESGFLNWLIGVRGLEHVSYPLNPWLIYPLVGFILGGFFSTKDKNSNHENTIWRARNMFLTLALLTAALLMFVLNRTFFRWGTVSFAFFIFSLGALAAFGLIAMYITTRSRWAVKILALRGMASFVVIPLHYSMLDIYTHLSSAKLNEWAFFLVTGMVVFLALFLSNKFGRIVPLFIARFQTIFLFLSLITLLGITVFLVKGGVSGWPLQVGGLVLTGQLIIACMLTVRFKSAH
jgi:uncharacterized membrane protein